MASKKLPYCVDCDGTYLKTDLFFETLLIAIKHKFFTIFSVVLMLLQGRAHLKSYLAKISDKYLNIKGLPRNAELLKFLEEKKQQGHEIYLVSASNEKLIKAIAAHDKIFKGSYGSTETLNLKGVAKAKFLSDKFPDGFIYVGDSCADLQVWKKAKQGVVVNASNCVVSKAKKITDVISIFPKLSFRDYINAWFKELRVYQAVKNLLIFLPLALTHKLGDIHSLAIVTMGFILLSILTCSTYILNDLLDLNEDRAHWSKAGRPVASGSIWITDAIVIFLLMMVSALVLSFLLKPEFGLWMVFYLFTTTAYSLLLKRIALVDITILAGLFTTRIVLGTVLLDISSSVWMLSFAFLFFISLAIVKRVTELQKHNESFNNKNNGRGYHPIDIIFLNNFGIASAIGSVILMLLYLIDQQYIGKGYIFPNLLWGIPVCIFLCSGKIWLEVLRGNMSDDPIIFAFTNRFCLSIIALAAFIFLLAGAGI